MWIKAEDGGAYNLDFAYAVNVRSTNTMPKSWEVYAIFTVTAAIKFKAGEPTQTITLLTTDSEEAAQQFLNQIVAKLGTV